MQISFEYSYIPDRKIFFHFDWMRFELDKGINILRVSKPKTL